MQPTRHLFQCIDALQWDKGADIHIYFCISISGKINRQTIIDNWSLVYFTFVAFYKGFFTRNSWPQLFVGVNFAAIYVMQSSKCSFIHSKRHMILLIQIPLSR